MRQFAGVMTILGMFISIGILGAVPTTVSVAQAVPDSETQWAALYYPSTSFDDTPLWLVNYVGLSLNFGSGPPLNPIPTTIIVDPEATAEVTAEATAESTAEATAEVTAEVTAEPIQGIQTIQVNLPLEGIPADGFAARYSANTPFDTGIYQFTVVADGGVKFSVNENVIIDDLGSEGLRVFTGIAFVGSGTARLILDYIERSGDAIVQVTWVEVSSQVLGSGDDPAATRITAPDTAFARVNGAVTGLALRSGPYLGASLVAVLRPGQDYEIIAQNNAEGEFTWYKLIVNERGQTGWASGRYLDVDFGNISVTECTVPNDSLTIAQSINPLVSNAGVAQSCFASVANLLNDSTGGDLTTGQLTDVVQSCGAFGLNNRTAIGGAISFVDDAKLVFDVYNVCTNGTCDIDSELALEIATQITPGYSGTFLEALVCYNTLAVLFDGQVSQQSIGNVISACSPIIVVDGTLTTNAVILNFINTVGGAICQTVNRPTLTVPVETSPFENLTTLPNTGVKIATRAVMNIRVRPSLRTADAGTIPWGDEAELLARTVQEGEDFWYLVRYQGIVGWIDASFATVRGNISDVPIY